MAELDVSNNGFNSIISYELQVDDGFGGPFKSIAGNIKFPS